MAGSVGITLTGDWAKASQILNNLPERVKPAFEAQLSFDGDMLAFNMRSHIYAQDLGWAPLSPSTIQKKHGNATIYIESGVLLGSIQAIAIGGIGDFTMFIGPRGAASKGVDIETVMGWMEFGTSKMPPRPLLRPTLDEAKDILKQHWRETLRDLLR